MTAAMYEICVATSLCQLVVLVQQYLEAGWLPTGGPMKYDNHSWCQAVYRAKE